MEVFYSNEIVVPLSTAYAGDKDLLFKKSQIQTEDGLNLFVENYLLSAVDTKINNYDALFLTKNVRNRDVFDLKRLTYNTQSAFATTIKFDSNQKFLRIASNFKDYLLVDESDRFTTFEIERISDTFVHIAFQHNFDRYYLNFNGTIFYFSTEPNFLNSRFNFTLEGSDLYLFTSRTGTIKSITATSDSLDIADLSTWKQNKFTVNFYVQELQTDLDATWASYGTHDKNSLQVDPLKSNRSLTSNTLVYNNYTYITGGEISSNFITLKNSHTHKNYSYRGDYLEKTDFSDPNVQLREYTSLNTGVDQEMGADSITLTYEFYNADYRFKADHYTIFTAPDSMYPFTQLNVKDTLFARNGAIGGDSPHTSDKVFFRDTRPGQSDGQYLCTWLSAHSSNQEGIWIDRYYKPERTSFASAITAVNLYSYTDPTGLFINQPLPPSAYYDAPYLWSSPDEEAAHTPQTIADVIAKDSFFDKRSDLIFVPGQEYIYHRIGNKIVTSVLNTLSSNLIINGLNLTTTQGSDITITLDADNAEYILDGNSFEVIPDFRLLNNSKQATISFHMQSDDWQKKIGHQIIGNYNDRGFAVVNDELVTPIVTVQAGTSVIFLNTDFTPIDTIYQSQSNAQTIYDVRRYVDKYYTTVITNLTAFNIRDLVRTDHLDYCSPVLATYRDSLTGVVTSSFLPPDEQVGLLLAEDNDQVIGHILADNAISTSLTPVSGVLLEPQNTPGTTLIPNN